MLSQYTTLSIFLSYLSQTTCQQSPLLCLEGINVSNSSIARNSVLGCTFSLSSLKWIASPSFSTLFSSSSLSSSSSSTCSSSATISSFSSSASLSFYFLLFGFWRSLYFFLSIFFCSFFFFSFYSTFYSSNKLMLLTN